MRQTEHARRLRELIDVVFAGNETVAAKVAGVQQATLNRIVTGKVTDPTLSTLQRFAKGYGVPVAWLVGEAPYHLGNAAVPNWYFLLRRYYGTSTAPDSAWLKRARGNSAEAKQAIKRAQSTSLNLVCDGWVQDLNLRPTGGKREREHMEAVRAMFDALRRDKQFAVTTLKARSDVTTERLK